MLGPLKKSKGLRDQVYEAISESLREGGLGMADSLREVDLAKSLNVSRTPVREALAMLEGDGVLESTSKGYVIRRILAEEIAEVFEIRRRLEPYAFSRCLPTLTAADIKALAVALKTQQKAHRDNSVEGFAKANTAFRNAWLDRVANTLLREVIHKYDFYVQYIQIATLSDPTTRKLILDSLGNIFEAVKSGDADQVHALMLIHLDHAEAHAFRASERGGN